MPWKEAILYLWLLLPSFFVCFLFSHPFWGWRIHEVGTPLALTAAQLFLPFFLLYSFPNITKYSFCLFDPHWGLNWRFHRTMQNDLLWLLATTSQPTNCICEIKLFSKAHWFDFINSKCQMAFYHLVTKYNVSTPFWRKFCFSSETSFHHSLSPFATSPMNNLGSTGSGIDLQETPGISFFVKTHYLFLQFEWDSVYKEKHPM